jgi:putative heme-binding domain-containing protein
LALLDAVESNRIPRGDLTAYTARQLRNLGNERVTARVTALWGELRATAEDKTRLIERYKRRLTPEALARADLSAGRATFQKVCANCHRLFDAGAAVGPDITGAQRKNIDYVLENLIDPSAAVSRDYQMQVVVTSGGRIITGLPVAETENAVTIQTVNERLVVPLAEIETRDNSPLSMMPDGMLNELSTEQVRNLVAYLASPTQVPLETADHAAKE